MFFIYLTLDNFRKKEKHRIYKKPDVFAPAKESMRQDLNLRPLRPERSALPN
jgi:hypothetical protein